MNRCKFYIDNILNCEGCIKDLSKNPMVIIIDLPEKPEELEIYYFNIEDLYYQIEVYDLKKYAEVKKGKADFYYLAYCNARIIHPSVLDPLVEC